MDELAQYLGRTLLFLLAYGTLVVAVVIIFWRR